MKKARFLLAVILPCVLIVITAVFAGAEGNNSGGLPEVITDGAAYVSIENRDYRTEYTYNAEAVPAPVAENFRYTDGSSLSFEWFEVKGDGRLIKQESQPKDAGDYILRVKAAPTATLIGSRLDIPVTIKKATLDIAFKTEELTPDFTAGDPECYLLGIGEEIEYEIRGLKGGDTLKSAGIHVDVSHRSAEGTPINSFPVAPSSMPYSVTYTVKSAGNYAASEKSINVRIKADKICAIPEIVTPNVGGAYFSVIIPWHPSLASTHYTVSVAEDYYGIWEEDEQITDSPTEDLRYSTFRIRSDGHYRVTVTGYDDWELALFSEIMYFDVNIIWNDEYMNAIDDIGEYLIRIDILDAEENYVESTQAVMDARYGLELRVDESEYNLDSDGIDIDPSKINVLNPEPSDRDYNGNAIAWHDYIFEDVEYQLDPEAGLITVENATVSWSDGTSRDAYTSIFNDYSSWSHRAGDGGVIHIFDSSCDDSCNVEGCQYTRTTAGHTGGMATCTARAVCDGCGAEYGEVDSSAHTVESVRFVQNENDADTHYGYALCCGKVDTDMGVQSHAGGHATCESKAICSKCHTEYGVLSAHTPSADDGDCTTAVLCSVCNKVTTEGKAAHTPSADDGDCTTAVLCSVCGKVMTEGKAAHSWNQGHATKQPTCVAKGERTFTCTECGKASVQETAADENAHVDSDGNYICDLCEAKLPKDGLSGGAIAGIVIGSAAILGGGGFALWWLVFRKKRII